MRSADEEINRLRARVPELQAELSRRRAFDDSDRGRVVALANAAPVLKFGAGRGRGEPRFRLTGGSTE